MFFGFYLGFFCFFFFGVVFGFVSCRWCRCLVSFRLVLSSVGWLVGFVGFVRLLGLVCWVVLGFGWVVWWFRLVGWLVSSRRCLLRHARALKLALTIFIGENCFVLGFL